MHSQILEKTEENEHLSLILMHKGKIANFFNYAESNICTLLTMEDILADINILYNQTYDELPFPLSFSSNDVIFALYLETRLVGTLVMFTKDDILNYREIGLMIIAEDVQDKGFQKYLVIPMAKFSYSTLITNVPLYSSVRVRSHKSQYLISKMAPLCGVQGLIPRGFFPHYLLDRDETGEYVLECGMFYEAHMKDRKKKIILPSIMEQRQFRISDSHYNPSVVSHFVDPTPCNLHLKDHKIYSLEHRQTPFIYSRNHKFVYVESSKLDAKVIHILRIHTLDFMNDIEENMVSVTTCLKCSHFSSDAERRDNIALIHLLIVYSFVPSAIFDVVEQGERFSVIHLTRWRNVKFQSDFAIYKTNQQIFANFEHDQRVSLQHEIPTLTCNY